MEGVRSGLVHLVRDFLVAHQTLKGVFESYRAGKLSFQQVKGLVGDNEGSVLFRIKERCHSLFREAPPGGGLAVRREVLFDLAVGSLFHEAMKFRENLYQRDVYGPRVESLRDEAGEEASELFDEFGKILAAAEVRLEEALHETEALLGQTRQQFRVLLLGYRKNGLITRCLIEQQELVNEVFDEGLDDLLADIHGSAAEGYVVAAHSYLRSASFVRAGEALAAAQKRYTNRPDLCRLARYAEGMAAFSKGDYERSLSLLNDWVEAQPNESEARYAPLALTAISGIDKLVDGTEGRRLSKRAADLIRRIQPLADSSPRPGSREGS